MSTKSTSPAHKAWRERQKAKRRLEPDTSITCDEASRRGIEVIQRRAAARRRERG